MVWLLDGPSLLRHLARLVPLVRVESELSFQSLAPSLHSFVQEMGAMSIITDVFDMLNSSADFAGLQTPADTCS